MAGDVALSLLGAATVLAVPGPTNALLAAIGSSGRRDGARLILAVVLGYAAAVIGLRIVGMAVFERLPEAAPIVRIILAGWLVFLGCRLWRRPPDGTAAPTIGARAVFTATVLNPKSAVFAFALWPDDVDGVGTAIWGVGLGVAVAGVSWLWLEVGRRIGALDARCGLAVARIGAVVLFGFALLLGGGTLARLV